MDQVFDDVFGCFVPVFPVVHQPELTQEELDAIAEAAERFYQYLAFV